MVERGSMSMFVFGGDGINGNYQINNKNNNNTVVEVVTQR